MRKPDELEKRVAETVVKFGKEYMGLQPESALVDLHESHILVTLRKVVSAAERECASDQAIRELLERLSSAAFDAVKSALESEVAGVVSRPVRRSRINVDPVAGDAIVSFILDETDKSTRSECCAMSRQQ